jgi:Flp pilus assembly protein TadD
MRSWIVIPLLAVGLGACAAKGKQAAAPENLADSPAVWTSAEGRLAGRLDMAETMLRAGEPERAMAVLSVARQEAGSSYEIDLLQAHAFRALGMVAEAVVLLEQHEQRNRRDAALQHLLGQLRYEAGDLEAAEASLARAAELAPEDAEIANNLGFLMLVSERAEEAVPWLRLAVSLDPAQQRYRSNLGFALAADGQSEQALQIFRSSGSEPLALARLGVAHERAEQRELALARYHQALQLDPHQPVARAGLERLSPRSDLEATP